MKITLRKIDNGFMVTTKPGTDRKMRRFFSQVEPALDYTKRELTKGERKREQPSADNRVRRDNDHDIVPVNPKSNGR